MRQEASPEQHLDDLIRAQRYDLIAALIDSDVGDGCGMALLKKKEKDITSLCQPIRLITLCQLWQSCSDLHVSMHSKTSMCPPTYTIIDNNCNSSRAVVSQPALQSLTNLSTFIKCFSFATTRVTCSLGGDARSGGYALHRVLALQYNSGLTLIPREPKCL